MLLKKDPRRDQARPSGARKRGNHFVDFTIFGLVFLILNFQFQFFINANLFIHIKL